MIKDVFIERMRLNPGDAAVAGGGATAATQVHISMTIWPQGQRSASAVSCEEVRNEKALSV